MNKHLSEIQVEEQDKLSMEPYYQFLIRYQDTKNYILALLDDIFQKVKGLKQTISQKSVQDQRDYMKKGQLNIDLDEYSNKLNELKKFQYQKDRNHFKINYLEKFEIQINEKEVFKCKDHDRPYTKICQQKHTQDLKYLFCDMCEIIQDCTLEKFESTDNLVSKMLRQQFQEMKQHIDTQIQFLYQRIVTEEEKINITIQKLGQLDTLKAFINQTEPFQQCEQLIKEINQLKNFRFQYMSQEQPIKILQKVDKLKFDVHNYQTLEIQDINPKFDIIEYNSQQYTQKDKIIIQHNTKEIIMYQNQGLGILVPTQISYKYKYIYSKINQPTNLICQICQQNLATNISIDRQIIQLFCEICSHQSKSEVLFQVNDLSIYRDSILRLTQRQQLQQNQQYYKLELPYKYDGAIELYCQKQDHQQFKINAICYSKRCDQVDLRLCCENCLQNHQHQGINEIKTIRSFLFDKYLDWYSIIEKVVSIDDKVQSFTRNTNNSILKYLNKVNSLDFNQLDNYFEMNEKFKIFFDQQNNKVNQYKIQHSGQAFLFKKLLQNILGLNQKLSSISQTSNDNKPQMIELLHYINSSDNIPKINKFEKGIIGHQICIKSTKLCMIDKIVLPRYSPKIDLILILSFQNCDIIINQIKSERNLSNSSIESMMSQNSQSLQKSQLRRDKIIIKLDNPLYLLTDMVYKLRIYPSQEQDWWMEEYRQVIDTDHQSIISQIRPTDELNKFIIRQFIVQCQVLIF